MKKSVKTGSEYKNRVELSRNKELGQEGRRAKRV